MLAVAVLVLATAAAPAPIGGFQEARWGMSPEQLKPLYADLQQSKERPDDFTAAVNVLGRPATATFEFVGNKLAAVVVLLMPLGTPPDPKYLSTYFDAQMALMQKYGNPAREVVSPSAKSALAAGDMKALHALLDDGGFTAIQVWATAPGAVSLVSGFDGLRVKYTSQALASALDAARPRPHPKPSGL